MKLELDPEGDVAYIDLSEDIGDGRVARTVEIEEGVLVDEGADGVVLGIELIGIHARTRLPIDRIIREHQVRTTDIHLLNALDDGLRRGIPLLFIGTSATSGAGALACAV